MSDQEWWDDHRNIAICADRMNDTGWPVDEIIRMIEKPWSYTAQFTDAVAHVNLAVDGTEETEDPWPDDEDPPEAYADLTDESPRTILRAVPDGPEQEGKHD